MRETFRTTHVWDKATLDYAEQGPADQETFSAAEPELTSSDD